MPAMGFTLATLDLGFFAKQLTQSNAIKTAPVEA